MSLEFNPNLYPPDGYIFQEPDGTRHRGESWRDLKDKIVRYRRANNFAAGDPDAEITAQVCARVPSFCRASNPQPAPIGPSFNAVVIQWLGRMLSAKRTNQLPRVDDAEAARRAGICARCPAQRSLNMSCGACLVEVSKLRRAVLDGSDSLHQNLQPCGMFGEDPQASVHIEQPKEKTPHAPPGCWRV